MAGRAILVADVDGLPEQAHAGGGLISPLGTAQEIANGISKLITQDLSALGRAARSGVSSQHNEILDGWLGVIERADAPARHRHFDRHPELASV